MKETGLMFKAPLVRGILDDLKTQTRRAFSEHMMKQMRAAAAIGEVSHFLDEGSLQPNDLAYVQQFSPVGQPGDRIYVRETWCQQADDDGFLIDNAYWYRATDPDVMDSEDMEKSPWRPSIHMPKSVARLWLEITGVRVERLQSISEDDCIAEGIHALPHQASEPGCWWTSDVAAGAALHGRTPRNAFQLLWESTGGDWHANPWVWVIDFKRIEKPR